METQLAKLKALWAAGDRPAALRLAAKWPRLGGKETADAIRKGASAAANPVFYAELGHDVPTLVQAAYVALVERYELQPWV